VGHRYPATYQVLEPAPDDVGLVAEAATGQPLHYMRTRGPDKVIYASDWPVLKMRRVVPEAQALDLPGDVLENYLYNNAHTFFFEGQESTDHGSLRTPQDRLQA